MKLSELKSILAQSPEAHLQFIFPDGDPIESEFHVTEVGYVSKKFIDCGGTFRSTEACVLQTWVAENDQAHRLTAGKLATILELAKGILPSSDLDVEIEYEGCVISQYTVESFAAIDNELTFQMGGKHTDCLAKEACGLESPGCC